MKRVKKKLKINFVRFFITFIVPVTLIIFAICFLFFKSTLFNTSVETVADNSSNIFSNLNNFPIINVDINPNYSGIGQKLVSGMDGYSKTFTTTSGRTYNEYKQNGTSSWANNPYWSDTMATDGCGITAMAIILSGQGSNLTPENLRQTYSPVLKADNISAELTRSYGVNNTDFFYDSTHLGSEFVKNHLNSNGPVLVCVWNKPTENRWTTQSHYMVLLAVDSEGLVYVSNPNGLDGTSKASGWYDFDEEIAPFLAKALFINYPANV